MHVGTGRGSGQLGGPELDVTGLDPEQLRILATDLRGVLRAREEQLERMMDECASLRTITKQLQVFLSPIPILFCPAVFGAFR